MSVSNQGNGQEKEKNKESKEEEEEEEEEDYMSMTLPTTTTTTNTTSSNPKKTSLQLQREKRHLASLRAHQKPKRQLEAEAAATRDLALATSTLETQYAASSKGALIMAKMGFKPGQALGRATQNGRKEPVQILLKQGKGGIGADAEAKKRAREDMEALQGREKARKVGEGEFRDRMAREREEKRLEGVWWGAMKVCERFDNDDDDAEEEEASTTTAPTSTQKKKQEQVNKEKKVTLLYRPLLQKRLHQTKQKQLHKSALDALSSYHHDPEADTHDKIALGLDAEIKDEYPDQEEEGQEDAELQDYLALQVHERVGKVVAYLRERYGYCFWCKYRYASVEEMDEACPGLEEEMHD
jgi:hypothetical protein